MGGGVAIVSTTVPDYAVFDDYRYSQRIAVTVRWFLLATWLFIINYRDPLTPTLVALNCFAAPLIVFNAYVHWRIWRGRPVTKRYVIALSLLDLALITAGIGATTRFGNTFYAIYYPALLGVSLVVTSAVLNFAIVTLVAGAYAALSVTLSPGVHVTANEDKVLIVRIACMYTVVVAATLITGIERTRRRQAVEAERIQAQRNLELQKKALDAEMAALAERSRIAREIHDGIAQSIYMLNLNLETCADLAEKEPGPLKDRLRTLVPLAKQTLLETRHYIYDLKPVLSGERGVVTMVENQVKEFRTVTGVQTSLSVEGQPRQVSVSMATGLYRILQEALANVLKHAGASQVDVRLAFTDAQVTLAVQDHGAGFDTSAAGGGFGLGNMRERAQELGGKIDIISAPGKGTCVSVALPTEEVQHEAG